MHFFFFSFRESETLLGNDSDLVLTIYPDFEAEIVVVAVVVAVVVPAVNSAESGCLERIAYMLEVQENLLSVS